MVQLGCHLCLGDKGVDDLLLFLRLLFQRLDGDDAAKIPVPGNGYRRLPSLGEFFQDGIACVQLAQRGGQLCCGFRLVACILGEVVSSDEIFDRLIPVMKAAGYPLQGRGMRSCVLAYAGIDDDRAIEFVNGRLCALTCRILVLFVVHRIYPLNLMCKKKRGMIIRALILSNRKCGFRRHVFLSWSFAFVEVPYIIRADG